MAKKNSTNTPANDDDDDDVEFSPRQLEVMTNTVNATVSAMLGRKLKPFQDQLAELPTIRETLATLATNLSGQGGQQQGAAGQQQQQQASAMKLEDHPEFVAMKKRDAAREAEREQERVQSRNAKRDQRLTELATAAGVDKMRVRGAVALLRDQVKYDKDGNPLMTVKRGEYDEDVGLDAGTAEFFKSDEGKSYLAPQQPARGAGGAGANRGTNAAAVVRGGGNVGGSNNSPVRGAQDAKADKIANARATLQTSVAELLGGGNIDVG